jgi:hypothetical protein
MEEITKLMQLIDSNSDSIKEGNYLEMCNTLKSLYNKIPKHEDPPIVDLRSPTYRRVIIPFMPIPRLDPRILEEWRINAIDITNIREHIRLLDRSLRSLKYLRNITESVKIESVIRKARELNIILDENTVDELRAAGVEIPSERDFYKEYIILRNSEISDEREEISQELLDNNIELETINHRQMWLADTYNL